MTASSPRHLTWVAHPPPGGGPPPPRPRRVPYAGPPAYPAPPRWGFPQITWRWPTSVPGEGDGSNPDQRTVYAARLASSVLALTAIAALLAAFGEFWRYVLLARSLTEQLTSGTLVSSDVWVNTTSVLTVILAIVAALATLVWVHRAQRCAGDRIGRAPARQDWQLVPALLVPGVNLVLPFSVLAELEHAAVGARGDRPRASRLVLTWWSLWLLSAVFLTAEVLWPLRGSSMQALADGVLVHAFGDLAAAALAVMTVVLIRRITALLDLSTVEQKLRRVVRTPEAGAPRRRERPAGAAR